jgi:hypothetical protein
MMYPMSPPGTSLGVSVVFVVFIRTWNDCNLRVCSGLDGSIPTAPTKSSFEYKGLAHFIVAGSCCLLVESVRELSAVRIINYVSRRSGRKPRRSGQSFCWAVPMLLSRCESALNFTRLLSKLQTGQPRGTVRRESQNLSIGPNVNLRLLCEPLLK